MAGQPAADDAPPGCLDLGNGEAMACGTASALRAVAEWLERHYPDGAAEPRSGPWFGPVLNMGASNALAALRLYAGKVPPTSLIVLVYMATVALDKDAEPWWSQGHPMLAIQCLGRSEPITETDKRAVERAIEPLFKVGAITTDRHASGHGGRLIQVRYRLWITQPAPDEKRRERHRQHPTKNVGSKGQHPTKSDGAPDEKRRTKEEEEELKQERDNTCTALELTDVEGARARLGQDRFSHWRDPQEIAGQQVAEDRARREAAERAAVAS